VTYMTEYNRETGILTLTLNEAHSFHSTSDRMPETAPPMEFYAEKLRKFGYEVTHISADKLRSRHLKMKSGNS